MAHKRLIGFSLLVAGTCCAQCPGTTRVHAHLQWSESAKVIAPDRSWAVEVRPILDADENQTPVSIHNCRDSKSWPLFTLQRSAELYWSLDSRYLLVVNQPLSGTNKLLFFTIPKSATGSLHANSDTLDEAVRDAVAERVGNGRHIQFYLPAMVSWKGSSILLAVGGETYTENTGPLDTYCYGVKVNSESLRVEEVLSEKQLKTNTGRSCQASP